MPRPKHVYSREYYEQNREHIMDMNRKWKKENPVYTKWRKIKERYGITREQYDAILLAQGGVCAICGSATPRGKGGTLHVDHDHASGRVRGLLCLPCNTRLAWYEAHASAIIRYAEAAITRAA